VIKIYLFVTGNLVAESMIIAAKALEKLSNDCEINIITDDSFCIIFNYSLSRFNKIDISKQTIKFEKGDVLITGLMWPGITEQELINSAKSVNATTIILYQDIAGTAQKLFIGNELLLPDYICVSDKITYENLLLAGVPGCRLAPLGSLYIDEIFNSYQNKAPLPDNNVIGYLSVPNKNDFKMWGHDLGYDEIIVAEDIHDICQEINHKLCIRKHPKEYQSNKYQNLDSRITQVEDYTSSSIIEFIEKCSVIISTYSTALVIAKKIGKHTISYQPNCDTPVRSALYQAMNIPISNNKNDVLRLMENYKNGGNIRKSEYLFFNRNRAADAFVDFIKEILICEIY
jgi:hypothetical protein